MSAAEASVWHQEQKTQDITEYYVIIRDDTKTASLILTHNAKENSIMSAIFTPPDINYTLHDGCDHENDGCVLDDPESEESQDVFMAEKHSHALFALEKQIRQRHMAERYGELAKKLRQETIEN